VVIHARRIRLQRFLIADNGPQSAAGGGSHGVDGGAGGGTLHTMSNQMAGVWCPVTAGICTPSPFCISVVEEVEGQGEGASKGASSGDAAAETADSAAAASTSRGIEPATAGSGSDSGEGGAAAAADGADQGQQEAGAASHDEERVSSSSKVRLRPLPWNALTPTPEARLVLGHNVRTRLWWH
jgi:hypothetical protein